MNKEQEMLSILLNEKYSDIDKNEIILLLKKINENIYVGKNPNNFIKSLNYYSKEEIINIVLDYYKSLNLNDYIIDKINKNEIKIYSKEEADGKNLLKIPRCRKIDDKVYVFLPLNYSLLDCASLVHELTHYLILNSKFKSKYDIKNRAYSEIESVYNELDFCNKLLKIKKYSDDIEQIYNYYKCVLQNHLTRFINHLYYKKIITKEERIQFGIRTDNFSKKLYETTNIDYSFRYVLAIKYLKESNYKLQKKTR